MSNDYNLPCYGDDTIWIKIQINVECVNNFLQKLLRKFTRPAYRMQQK